MFFLFLFWKAFLKGLLSKKKNKLCLSPKNNRGKSVLLQIMLHCAQQCVPKTECAKESDKTLPRLCATCHHLTMCHPVHKTKSSYSENPKQ